MNKSKSSESAASKTLRLILYALFPAGALVTITMPFMIDTYMAALYDAYAIEAGYKTFITVFLMAVGALGLFIIFELVIILRTIPKDPFVKRNVRSLNVIGSAAFVCAAMFFLKCFLYVTIMTLLCGACLVILGLFAFVLGDMFARAVAYKQENDLTI